MVAISIRGVRGEGVERLFLSLRRVGAKKSRIEIQPRFKIQYPMKNRDKDGDSCRIIQEGKHANFKLEIKKIAAGVVKGYKKPFLQQRSKGYMADR